jgi:hypothetical protein
MNNHSWLFINQQQGVIFINNVNGIFSEQCDFQRDASASRALHQKLLLCNSTSLWRHLQNIPSVAAI